MLSLPPFFSQRKAAAFSSLDLVAQPRSGNDATAPFHMLNKSTDVLNVPLVPPVSSPNLDSSTADCAAHAADAHTPVPPPNPSVRLDEIQQFSAESQLSFLPCLSHSIECRILHLRAHQSPTMLLSPRFAQANSRHEQTESGNHG